MTVFSSAVLPGPNDTEIHLLGVSHTSALYGKLAHEAIRTIQPGAVVLEVDEDRLREQAARARQWIHENDRRGLVRAAVEPYLGSSVLEQLQALSSRQQSYRLTNEGAALLEGAIYGSEVIRACQAAVDCQADIIAADRSKTLSNARLQAAIRQEQQQKLESVPDDDFSLLAHAAQSAAIRLYDRLCGLYHCATVSDAQAFAERLHPVFMLADSMESYRPFLETVGVPDPEGVQAALRQLMGAASSTHAEIHASDLDIVQDCIERIEAHKHLSRRLVLQGENSTAKATQGAAQSTDSPLTGPRSGPPLAPVPDSAFPVITQSSLALAASPDPATSPAAMAGTAANVFESWCWRGAEHMYSFSATQHSGRGGGAAAGAPGSEPAGGAPATDGAAASAMDGMTPYYRTTVYERDRILSHRIWEVAAATGAGKVVAVVGANHLSGIVDNWQHAQQLGYVPKCDEFLVAPACDTGHGANRSAGLGGACEGAWKVKAVDRLALGMEVMAGGAAACGLLHAGSRMLPRRWHCLAVAAAGCAAVGGAVASAGWQQMRVARLVENLARHQDMRVEASAAVAL